VFKDRHSSLGGEDGERIALVNDRFATAFGGDPKGRHCKSASASPKLAAIG
jgi:hypothetical protein